MSGSWLRERVARSGPPEGGLQLHELADPPVSYFCPRCGWRGYVWKVATVDGDWSAPVCHGDLHPGIAVVVSYWSVSVASYQRKTPEDRLPFTVIRSRKIAGQLGGRDEMYRAHFSQDSDVWEFTSVLVEEARDGSSWDVEQISEADARAIMERTRAKYLPVTNGAEDP